MSDKTTAMFAASVHHTEDSIEVRVDQSESGAYVQVHIPKDMTDEQVIGFETMVMELHATIAMMMTVITDDIDSLEADTASDTHVRVQMEQ